jgi:hypothetical protein
LLREWWDGTALCLMARRLLAGKVMAAYGRKQTCHQRAYSALANERGGSSGRIVTVRRLNQPKNAEISIPLSAAACTFAAGPTGIGSISLHRTDARWRSWWQAS